MNGNGPIGVALAPGPTGPGGAARVSVDRPIAAAAPRSRSREAGERQDGRGGMRTTLDPETIAILETIALEPATSAEIADALGLEIEVVRRHLRRLSDRGQVVRAGRAARLTHQENLYQADLRATVLDPTELAGASRSRFDAARLALVRAMFREAVAAKEAGIFRRRAESSLARSVIPVDELARHRVAEVHRRLLGEVVEEAERARVRLERTGEDPIDTAGQVFFSELPVDRWPLLSDSVEVGRSPIGDRTERILRPPKAGILETLSVLRESATGLAERLDVPISKVRYELDRFLADDLVTIVGTRPSRGTVERVFIANPRAMTLSAEQLEAAEMRTLGAYEDWLVRSIFREALAAMEPNETADDGEGPFVGRVLVALDARGFARIASFVEAALRELSELRERSLEARDTGVAPAHLFLSGILMFERPGRPSEDRPNLP